LKHVYHTLGKTGAEVDRRCISLELVAGSEDVDGLLERFEGVQLVGPGRAVGDAEAAVIGQSSSWRDRLIYGTVLTAETTRSFTVTTAASKSQALAGHKIVAMVASDHSFGDDDSVLRRIGSILTFMIGHILTWQYKEEKGSVEVSLDSIKKVEDDLAEPAAEEHSPISDEDCSEIDDVLLGEGPVPTDIKKSICQAPVVQDVVTEPIKQVSILVII
jgi:hypothetical protein